MLYACLILALTMASATVAVAGALTPTARVPSCRGGVQHVSLLSPAQMCPRPLATTMIARPRHGTLRT